MVVNVLRLRSSLSQITCMKPLRTINSLIELVVILTGKFSVDRCGLTELARSATDFCRLSLVRQTESEPRRIMGVVHNQIYVICIKSVYDNIFKKDFLNKSSQVICSSWNIYVSLLVLKCLTKYLY